MITQGILDFFRDVQANFISGFGSLVDGVGGPGAAAYVASAFGNASHFVALFVSSVAWAALLASFGSYVFIWLASGIIAIFARRGTAS